MPLSSRLPPCVIVLSALMLCTVAWAQQTGSDTSPSQPAIETPPALPVGYPTAEQVRQRLYQAAQENPDLCKAFDLTEQFNTPPTHEGRHLYAIRISSGVASDQDKPAVLFVAAHHGDEVASVVTALTGIDTLVDGYGTDPTISHLLDTHEVWIAPLWNPDGYTNGTRTNARRNENDTIGVDLNRNYPFGFAQCGGSAVAGTLNYQGPSPASEPETQTMLAFAREKRFMIVHDAHSGAFDLRTGYGCDRIHPWEEHLNRQAAQIIEATGLEFARGSSCCLAGNIHAHMAISLANAFLWELGDKKQPAEKAREQAKKVWSGVVANFAQPVSVTGHTADATTRQPIPTTITIPSADFTMNESGATRGSTARFDLILPPGTHTIQFSADGYESITIDVTIEPGTTQTREIQLIPLRKAPPDTASPA